MKRKDLDFEGMNVDVRWWMMMYGGWMNECVLLFLAFFGGDSGTLTIYLRT
jgi:hypothetical protein